MANADTEELRLARDEASGFRSRREAVYPGVLLAMRGSSTGLWPVDDETHDPTIERLMGVAAWGADRAFAVGMVRIEGGPAAAFAPLVAGEARRPATGVGRIDAWIARADALRKLRLGKPVAFGGIPLSTCQLTAAVGEVERLVRESAIGLLRVAPTHERDARLALSRAADSVHPADAELTTAILELTASAPSWRAAGAHAEVPGGDARGAGEQGGDTPAARLPELKAHDRQAWQLATLHGMTQDTVAAALNREHGKTYTQGQVSRMIARAKAHAEASGLAEKVPGPVDRPRTGDPGRLELGARVDKRKPRPSDIARANDDDE